MTARSAEFEHGVVAARARLMAFAMKLTRDRDRAEDLVSDTLVKALEHHETFQPGTNLKGWLFTILRNLFITKWRRSGREVSDPDGIIASLVPVEEGQSWAVDLKVIRKRMRFLSPDYRRIIELVAILGYDYEYAAQQLGIPVGSVKSGLHRARHYLETGEELVEVVEQPAATTKVSHADAVERLYREGKSVSEIKTEIEGIARSEIMQVILDRKLSARRA
jgi:RNA polymerase sigma-70 factor (ECF subfamily)